MDGPGLARRDLGPAWARLIERLKERSRLGMVLGTDRLDRVLAQLGRPERAFPAIHIAGTNGKGSTSAFLASIASQRGKRVGLYTSPHLISLTERVQVVSRGVAQEIDAERLLAAFDAVEKVAPDFGELTFFEVITAAGLVALAELGVDLAVIEAGIGAKNDATRVVDAEVSVLCEVSLEHTQILGDTVEAIAEDKVAVLRPGRPLVAADASPAAMAVVERFARLHRSPLFRIGREIDVYGASSFPGGPGFELVLGPDRTIDRVAISLPGAHQGRNALLAAKAATLLDSTLDDDDVRRALATTAWPGRMETIDGVLLDGAHNPQGVDALVAALDTSRPLHVVFAVLGDKDAAPMVRALAGVASSLTLTRPTGTPRARSPGEVRAMLPPDLVIPCEAIDDVHAAVEHARARARADGGRVVVAGSLYLVGEVRGALLAVPT